MKKILVFVLVILVLGIGCEYQLSEPLPSYDYLPDGRMVLLQTSGEDRPVEFADANLETVIRDELEAGAIVLVGEPISSKDLETLTSLYASERNITDLTGLEYCINLQFIDLRWNNVSDLSTLAKLPGITVISQDEMGSNFTFLRLVLAYNQIEDITPLSELAGIDYLNIDLVGNRVSNLTSLTGLRGLRHLYLTDNNIQDVSMLGSLSGLTILNLGGNNIDDVSALAWCSLLDSLSLWNNKITDISPLTELENLTWLTLDGNLIYELPSLSGKWQHLHFLDLGYNQIKDASAIKDLPETCEVVLTGNPLE